MALALASPSSPLHSPNKYTKDTAEFTGNFAQALKLAPIEFVEASGATLAYSTADSKYGAINEVKNESASSPVASTSATTLDPTTKVSGPQPPQPSPTKSDVPIPGAFPTIQIINTVTFKRKIGRGLDNLGNTCFMNSVLQALLHTPPLIHILSAHSKQCPIKAKQQDHFCMTCAMIDVARDSFIQPSRTSFAPRAVAGRLRHIAKHMQRGRQEDAHEFLRYCIDAFQKACLAERPPKLDHKTAETSWVHQLFGGRLRSRVTCRKCKHPSDTFDSILDLSLDVHNVDSLQAAMKRMIAIDVLGGADKYNCEKCKQPVNAEKQFTLHDAPAVLTVHLKRFSPLGRKIGHAVSYDEQISLAPIMSDGQYGPKYTLYAIISHAGGGPNSGHYHAHIKSFDGRWYHMDDESVTPRLEHKHPQLKSAYILMYLRNSGEKLQNALSNSAASSKGKNKRAAEDDADVTSQGSPSSSSHKRQKLEDSSSTPAFIGPILPQSGPPRDPQALSLKSKISAASGTRNQPIAGPSRPPANSSTAVRKPLVDYADDDDDEDVGEAASTASASAPASVPPPSSPPSRASSPPTQSTVSSTTSSTTVVPNIASSSFYGTKSKGKQRQTTSDSDNEDRFHGYERPATPIPRQPGSLGKRKFRTPHNPYSAAMMKDDLGKRGGGSGSGGGKVYGMRAKLSGGYTKKRMLI